MTRGKNTTQIEDGIEVPYGQINPETLRRMIQEFVSRDGADWGDPGCTLEEKVEQVCRQLKNKKARIVYDQKTETVNIVVSP
ncbi:YheU family protein [Geoalkalibacter subterraneus]|uniref:YheU family protein n=1 Tax=Geoalkalibacter subterraneus TaxID=483547 RepID=A0A0B5FER3_9BACT|nr:YheU family protein [Geoalkalibacter subterraneus]AJF06612.1 hypothetical protein GSUB_08710 [Geoalkalibacter subterraneus]